MPSSQPISLQLLRDRLSRIGLGEEYPVDGTIQPGISYGSGCESNNSNSNSNSNINSTTTTININNNNSSSSSSTQTTEPQPKPKPAKKTNPHQQSLRNEGRTASVLVLVSSDAHVLFTLRSRHLRSHPGQVSFPGGRQDPEDRGDDVVTALRETREEVGLDYTGVWNPMAAATATATGTTAGTAAITIANDDNGSVADSVSVTNYVTDNTNNDRGVRILCRMPTTQAIGRLCVVPIVAVHEHRSWRELHELLKLNRDEVEEAFWVPLSFFADDTNLRECYDVPDWPSAGETFVYRNYGFSCPLAEKSFAITGLTAQVAHDVALAVVSGSELQLQCRSTAAASGSCSERLTAAAVAAAVPSDGSLVSSTTRTATLRGFLRRKTVRRNTRGSQTRQNWTRCFFVASGNATGSGGILHQYDSPEQALRKEPSATKKNRLRLAANTETDRSCTVVKTTTTGVAVAANEAATDDDGDSDGDSNGGCVFVVSTLGGRIRWELQASSPEERTLWIEHIESIVNQTRE